jgi:hypothetical protein
MLPVYSVRDVPGPYRVGNTPLPLGFSQVVILKLLKVVCFHTLLQVLILKDVRPTVGPHLFPGLTRRVKSRTGKRLWEQKSPVDRRFKLLKEILRSWADYFTKLIYKKVSCLSAKICCEPIAAILGELRESEATGMDVEWRAFSSG